ncbi:o-succinylbenzoate synthase [Clostridium sp. HV4-5-A1G]|uniref:o-succinylbenzoate synthase n=1 Tax=Clostridium sp. HV4-5-A1G TaxID=2004595 RepID=UPI00123846DA|nr:o-succinylbenzoate synthase [Clostridium sp. HV4-5-A1G]KAA8676017.1 o-succinylbenzoate synthase [Clostridium sp. HV4-5-A1G]
MKINKIVMRQVQMPFKKAFETSFDSMKFKNCLIVEIHDEDGNVGYGECSTFAKPYYNEEFIDGAWALLENSLIPQTLAVKMEHPDETSKLFSRYRCNEMAKSSINCALWDLYAKENKLPLAKALGGTKDKVETGVSIGIQKDVQSLLDAVKGYIEDGYHRVKIKIKPGKDVEYMTAVRKKFGDIMLMADANSAYTLDDVDTFKKLDELGLIMIEQPLAHDDIVDHAELQSQIKTKICLDESIVTLEDARKAIKLKSCGIINIKVARVGGLTEAKKIQKLGYDNGIGIWCGGMLDSGIARAHNIAAATLRGYTLPNDIAASERYYAHDIINPMIKLDGTFIDVPKGSGIGFDPDIYYMDKFTVKKAVYSKKVK